MNIINSIGCRIEPEDLEDPYLGDIMEIKPDWCSLNPIPEKQINNNLYDEYYEGFDAGWNACIDEILKGD